MKSNKSGFEEEKERREGKSLDEIIQEIFKTLNIFIQKSAIAGVILGLLMTYNPHLAVLAASGGTIGGRSFSSSSSGGSSSSSSSRSSSSSLSPSYSSRSSSPSSSWSSSSSSSPTYVLHCWVRQGHLKRILIRLLKLQDTSTPSGLSYILQESTVALLRHLAYCFSSYSSVDVKPDKVGGEKLFNKLTIEERAKLDEETLVNVDNIKKQSTPSKRANGLSSDYIVMTILVAAMGEYKLGVINNSDNLKEALTKLGSIPTSKILAVEVMWTPQEENDTLTEREMLEDYPRLRPL
ncbi:hypothetical protein MKX01_028609 [Papaver californicum]|nr:hypothetical protein MKX01_028609 [Papaver californicum]